MPQMGSVLPISLWQLEYVGISMTGRLTDSQKAPIADVAALQIEVFSVKCRRILRSFFCYAWKADGASALSARSRLRMLGNIVGVHLVWKGIDVAQSLPKPTLDAPPSTLVWLVDIQEFQAH